MNISVASNDLRYALDTAVLVYKAKNNEVPFITCHSVPAPTMPGGQPTLGVARPINQEFVRSLARSLASKIEAEILPENVLARTDELLLWWLPETQRPMYFLPHRTDDAKPLASLNGSSFPHPALVFMVTSGCLTVRALASNQRPKADTPLMVAPYWNVNIEGDVCLGSMRHPKSLSVSAIEGWQDGFFNSRFSHPNTPLLTKFPKGIVALWKKIAGKKTYPVEMLVPTKQTLTDLLL